MEDIITGIGNFIKPIANNASPILDFVQKAAPIAGMAMGMMGGGGNKTQTSMTTQHYKYPTESEIAGLRLQGQKKISDSARASLDNLTRNLSVRGIGPGSAYAAGAMGGIEQNKIKSFADLESQLYKILYTGTPMGSTTTTETPSSSNPLAMALGMMSYGKGSGATKAKDPWEDYFNYAGTYNLNQG